MPWWQLTLLILFSWIGGAVSLAAVVTRIQGIHNWTPYIVCSLACAAAVNVLLWMLKA